MNRSLHISFSITLFLLLCLCAPRAQAQGEASPFSFSRKYHHEKLLIAGCGWNKIAVIDKQTARLEWEHLLGKGEDCNDVELTAQKNILYAYTQGARLITPSQQVVWDYPVTPKSEELFTATQLANGHYLLAICGHPARIVELDKEGKLLKEICFETGIEQVHNQFRQIEKSKSNSYLVPLFATGELIEIDESGTVLHRLHIGGTLFSVKQLKGNRAIVACGDGHKWVEVDTGSWQVIRTLSSDNLQGVTLLFVAEPYRLNNGRTLISNWNGHSTDKSQPKLIEVDRKNRVTWQLPHQADIKNISAVHPLP